MIESKYGRVNQAYIESSKRKGNLLVRISKQCSNKSNVNRPSSFKKLSSNIKVKLNSTQPTKISGVNLLRNKKRSLGSNRKREQFEEISK